MIVKDIMQTSVIRVSETTPIREVAKLIFSKGISGAPVIKGKKLVGMVTEEDIFSHMYPTIQEIIEDYPHAHDFTGMEHNIVKLLDVPVSKIMVKQVHTVTADTPIMKAQGIMLTHNFSRLPVVDKKGNLIGIVSQGDIFRELIKHEIPKINSSKKRHKRK